MKESVLKKNESGMRLVEISRTCVLPQSTVRTIIKNKDNIKQATINLMCMHE